MIRSGNLAKRTEPYRLTGPEDNSIQSTIDKPSIIDWTSGYRLDSGQIQAKDSLRSTGYYTLGPNRVGETERGTNPGTSDELGDKTPTDNNLRYFATSNVSNGESSAPNPSVYAEDAKSNKHTVLFLVLLATGAFIYART